jgi:hypothetical protein
MTWTCDKCNVSYHTEAPERRGQVYRCERPKCHTTYQERERQPKAPLGPKYVELYLEGR